MSNATVIGIDHGNNMIKTVHTAFSSKLVSNGNHPPLNTQDYLFWDGIYYVVDNTAHPAFAPDKTDTATTDGSFFKLTLMAIAKELAYTESYIRAATPYNPMQIVLAIGLPPLHVSSLKGKYEDFFAWENKPITFKYGNETYHIRISKVHVFTQGHAASCTSDPAISEFRTKFPSYYIIDVGGFTMDCMLISKENGLEIGKCETLHFGVNHLINEIQKVFTRTFSSKCEESIIRDELSGIDTGMPETSRKIIQECKEAYAQKICGELKDKEFDIERIPALFVGGGSILFEQSLRQIASINPNSIFVRNIHANATGYQLLGRFAEKNAFDV